MKREGCSGGYENDVGGGGGGNNNNNDDDDDGGYGDCYWCMNSHISWDNFELR